MTMASTWLYHVSLHHGTAVGVCMWHVYHGKITMVEPRLNDGRFYQGFYNGKNYKGDYFKEPWFDHGRTVVDCRKLFESIMLPKIESSRVETVTWP